jgi:hypothetical protein
MQFFAKCDTLWVIDGPYNFLLFHFKKVSKWGPNSEILYIWKVYRIFFHLILLNGLCWELSVICQWISSIFSSFWDKLNQKRLKSANFQNLKVFSVHLILMQYLEVFILMEFIDAILSRKGAQILKFANLKVT